ncbi:LuxR C-terminal-related transcriptional regulator [Metabacillus fastidiosus]|uniref:response regulator transcription factor n=1 Tax=Metabacillus fastidiosus TaxID=1458 RepID=UPI003D2686E4
MSDVLNLNNVTKAFKDKTAVNKVSFSIGKGEIVAILGPNGAGKTTKEITAELFLSSGTVRNYISEVIHKLGAKNRTEAASIADEKG